MRGTSILASLLCLGTVAGCHHDSTSPVTSADLGYTFTPDAGVRVAAGTQAAPLVVNGVTYLYLTTGNAPNTVLRATDGLNFSPVAASYPAGTSYSLVAVATGGYRMYYFNTTTGILASAFSSDGLNWTAELGARLSLPSNATPKAVAVPDSGYRVFYTTSGIQDISSAFSADGLNFFPEIGTRVAMSLTSFWTAPCGLFVGANGWLMATTEFSVGVSAPSAIWLAASPDSSDGVWSTDTQPIVSSASNSLGDPALVPVGSGYRVYYTSTPGPVFGVTLPQQGQILSGIISPP
jgi:hypothetical protein